MLDTALQSRLAFDLRATWQARALEAARGQTAAVLLSVLAHNYDEQMLTLLQVTFPGFTSIQPPFLVSAGRVMKNGAVVADVFRAIGKHGTIDKKSVLYRNEI